jgi:hypothetical protein
LAQSHAQATGPLHDLWQTRTRVCVRTRACGGGHVSRGGSVTCRWIRGLCLPPLRVCLRSMRAALSVALAARHAESARRAGPVNRRGGPCKLCGPCKPWTVQCKPLRMYSPGLAGFQSPALQAVHRTRSTEPLERVWTANRAALPPPGLCAASSPPPRRRGPAGPGPPRARDCRGRRVRAQLQSSAYAPDGRVAAVTAVWQPRRPCGSRDGRVAAATAVWQPRRPCSYAPRTAACAAPAGQGPRARASVARGRCPVEDARPRCDTPRSPAAPPAPPPPLPRCTPAPPPLCAAPPASLAASAGRAQAANRAAL